MGINYNLRAWKLLIKEVNKLKRSMFPNEFVPLKKYVYRVPHDKPYRAHVKDTCETCGFKAIDKCQLDVDHIDGNHNNNDIKNLQTLCANCHRLKTKRNRDTQKRRKPKTVVGCLVWCAMVIILYWSILECKSKQFKNGDIIKCIKTPFDKTYIDGKFYMVKEFDVYRDILYTTFDEFKSMTPGFNSDIFELFKIT